MYLIENSKLSKMKVKRKVSATFGIRKFSVPVLLKHKCKTWSASRHTKCDRKFGYLLLRDKKNLMVEI